MMHTLLLKCLVVLLAAAVPACAGKPLTSSLGQEFVYINPGTFMMGSPSSEADRDMNEAQHQVTLTQGYYLQTTEVTQGQWKALMGGNPSHYSDCGDDCPVENVSWNDAQEFIRKLNHKENTNRYRLPTEAEWEYAARAGTTGPFAFGNCLSTEQANYNGNHPAEECPKGHYRRTTVKVGSFSPNAWGIYDMHGNVYEWVQDWYGEYPANSVTDPAGPLTGTDRVRRGGGWRDGAGFCRSAGRVFYSPGYRINNLGFRLAASATNN